jgi:hypothetical protein
MNQESDSQKGSSLFLWFQIIFICRKKKKRKKKLRRKSETGAPLHSMWLTLLATLSLSCHTKIAISRGMPHYFIFVLRLLTVESSLNVLFCSLNLPSTVSQVL